MTDEQEQRVASIIASHASLPHQGAGPIDLTTTFRELGIDSLKFLIMALELEEVIGRSVLDLLPTSATPLQLLANLKNPTQIKERAKTS